MKQKYILLGAFCQREFNLAPDFEIKFIPPNSSRAYNWRRTEVENETLFPVTGTILPVGSRVVDERIDLVLVGDNQTRFWCGYSLRMKTLFVMDE